MPCVSSGRCLDPSSPSLRRSGKSPERSAGLRALLRLSSRVQVYLQRPFDVFLRVRIFRSLRGVRKLVPELPFTHLIDGAFHRALQDLVCQYVRQENEAGKQRWRLRIRDNECAARTYIKRRADQALEREKTLASRSLPASGCNPAVEIDKQASIWNSRWRRLTMLESLRLLPSWLKSLSPPRVRFASRASPLATHGLPKLLLGSLLLGGSMPLNFGGIKPWPCDALLMPGPGAKRACCGKTTVKLAQLLFCAGAQLLNRWLASWALSWRGSFDCAGLPGSSVASALQMLQHELHQGCRLAVQQDVSGYFDCLEHELTCAVLRHLRAPEPFVALFEHVCSSSTRIFCLQGAWSETWIHPRRGLPQGCPLSPLVSAAMTHAWACWVFGSSVSPQSPINGLGYIDDRLLLLRANHEIAALRSAVSRSGQFDRAFGLEVSLKKCAVVAACNDCEALQLAASLDYQFKQTIQTLGAQASWGPP